MKMPPLSYSTSLRREGAEVRTHSLLLEYGEWVSLSAEECGSRSGDLLVSIIGGVLISD
jgi:hypothetical protein